MTVLYQKKIKKSAPEGALLFVPATLLVGQNDGLSTTLFLLLY